MWGKLTAFGIVFVCHQMGFFHLGYQHEPDYLTVSVKINTRKLLSLKTLVQKKLEELEQK